MCQHAVPVTASLGRRQSSFADVDERRALVRLERQDAASAGDHGGAPRVDGAEPGRDVGVVVAVGGQVAAQVRVGGVQQQDEAERR